MENGGSHILVDTCSISARATFGYPDHIRRWRLPCALLCWQWLCWELGGRDLHHSKTGSHPAGLWVEVTLTASNGKNVHWEVSWVVPDTNTCIHPNRTGQFWAGQLEILWKTSSEQISINLTQTGVTRKMLTLSERIRCVSVWDRDWDRKGSRENWKHQLHVGLHKNWALCKVRCKSNGGVHTVEKNKVGKWFPLFCSGSEDLPFSKGGFSA